MKTLLLLATGLALSIAAATPAAAQFASTGDGIFGNFYSTDRNVATKDRPQIQPLPYQSQPKAKAPVLKKSRPPLDTADAATPSGKHANHKIAR